MLLPLVVLRRKRQNVAGVVHQVLEASFQVCLPAEALPRVRFRGNITPRLRETRLQQMVNIRGNV